MKKNLFQFKMRRMTVLPVIALFAFMLMGSVSVSAQYIGKSESVKELGTQLRTIQTEIQQMDAPTLQEKGVVTLRQIYVQTVRNKILDGAGVAQALTDAELEVKLGQQGVIQQLPQGTFEGILDDVDDSLQL